MHDAGSAFDQGHRPARHRLAVERARRRRRRRRRAAVRRPHRRIGAACGGHAGVRDRRHRYGRARARGARNRQVTARRRDAAPRDARRASAATRASSSTSGRRRVATRCATSSRRSSGSRRRRGQRSECARSMPRSSAASSPRTGGRSSRIFWTCRCPRRGASSTRRWTARRGSARAATCSCNWSMPRARTTPVLITIEDLHWADTVTLTYVAALARATPKSRALLVLTSRADGDPLAGGFRASLAGCALITLDLAPLTDADAVTLAGGLFATSAALARKCIERAGGNPLFLEQLLRTAEESDDRLPASLHSLVLARVDRLPERERAALRAAAVLGQRFPLAALRHLTAAPDYDCGVLLAGSLVRPDGEEFLFAHALIRDGIYASLTRTRRAELHRAAASWYGERDPTLHAEHLDRAEAPEAARAYFAAAQAQSAALHPEQALALAERGAALAREPGRCARAQHAVRPAALRGGGRQSRRRRLHECACGSGGAGGALPRVARHRRRSPSHRRTRRGAGGARGGRADRSRGGADTGAGGAPPHPRQRAFRARRRRRMPRGPRECAVLRTRAPRRGVGSARGERARRCVLRRRPDAHRVHALQRMRRLVRFPRPHAHQDSQPRDGRALPDLSDGIRRRHRQHAGGARARAPGRRSARRNVFAGIARTAARVRRALRGGRTGAAGGARAGQESRRPALSSHPADRTGRDAVRKRMCRRGARTQSKRPWSSRTRRACALAGRSSTR